MFIETGMLDMVLPLSEQPPYGTWTIQVRFYVRNILFLATLLLFNF